MISNATCSTAQQRRCWVTGSQCRAGIFPILGAVDQQIGEICVHMHAALAAAELAAVTVEPPVLHTPPRAEV